MLAKDAIRQINDELEDIYSILRKVSDLLSSVSKLTLENQKRIIRIEQELNNIKKEDYKKED